MRFNLGGDSYTLGHVLGRGRYGTVRTAKSDARTVAVKCSRLEGTLRAIYDREKRLLRRVAHESRISHIIGGFELCDHGYLVLELANGNLAERLSNVERTIAGAHMISAVAALHGCGVTHRDIRLENFLLVGHKIKLADLGLASDQVLMHTLEVQTWWYRAPEIFLGLCPYTPAVDFWALGVLLMHVLIGRFPVDLEEDEMLERIFHDRNVPIPKAGQNLSIYAKSPCATTPPLKRWHDKLAQLNPEHRTPVAQLVLFDPDVRMLSEKSALVEVDVELPPSKKAHTSATRAQMLIATRQTGEKGPGGVQKRTRKPRVVYMDHTSS